MNTFAKYTYILRTNHLHDTALYMPTNNQLYGHISNAMGLGLSVYRQSKVVFILGDLFFILTLSERFMPNNVTIETFVLELNIVRTYLQHNSNTMEVCQLYRPMVSQPGNVYWIYKLCTGPYVTVSYGTFNSRECYPNQLNQTFRNTQHHRKLFGRRFAHKYLSHAFCATRRLSKRLLLPNIYENQINSTSLLRIITLAGYVMQLAHSLTHCYIQSMWKAHGYRGYVHFYAFDLEFGRSAASAKLSQSICEHA